MEWINTIQNSVEYIENNLTNPITPNDVADYVHISHYYFQKGFAMLCGYTVSEYIRNRRLSLAGSELLLGNKRIIDIALKYGYDSPDSFTKAFTRFHGISPGLVQKNKMMIKTFAPLKINVSLKGGYIMNYKLIEKDSFTVVGASKKFSYETCKQEIPLFWEEHFKSGGSKYISGMLGVNIDDKMGGKEFEYMISDFYNPSVSFPDKYVIKEIPAFTWAVFPCDGPMPDAFRNVHKKIFSEWLPALKEYEFAAGYCIEKYDDPSDYENGVLDSNYHSEIWIPVKKMQN